MRLTTAMTTIMSTAAPMAQMPSALMVAPQKLMRSLSDIAIGLPSKKKKTKAHQSLGLVERSTSPNFWQIALSTQVKASFWIVCANRSEVIPESSVEARA